MRPGRMLIRPQESHTEGPCGVIDMGFPPSNTCLEFGLWIWGVRDRWLGGDEEGRQEDREGKRGGREERERSEREIW